MMFSQFQATVSRAKKSQTKDQNFITPDVSGVRYCRLPAPQALLCRNGADGKTVRPTVVLSSDMTRRTAVTILASLLAWAACGQQECPVGVGIQLVELLSTGSLHRNPLCDAGHRLHRDPSD